MPARYTITAALPYANGPLHIGHIAGAYLPADIFVRYLRLKGKEVAFICGSDEHGVPITLRARNEGVPPQEIVDRYHTLNKKSFERFGIDFDIFHRTSSKLHHRTASDFFKKMYEADQFIEKEEQQYFDEENQEFLADRYIVGTCPKCGYDNAYGDQCEKCGCSLSPRELIDPKSVLSGHEPVLKKTKHWYLPLDKYQDEWLEDWIDSHKGDWKPNVYGQCKSWLDQKLRPRAVTRDLPWGVPVPIEEAKDKVLYVWFDAPIGYISATKAWAKETGKDWKKYWQDEDTSLIHFIGKDNIVFHCLIFPAMLKAHGDYILPDNVPSNEFLNLEGEKLSTSRNWAVWLHEYLEEFPDRQDELRYVLCANMPETKDNNFSWKDYKNRVNSELVGVLGNFIHRVGILIQKYYDGKVPEPAWNHTKRYEDKELKNLLTSTSTLPSALSFHLEEFKFRRALKAYMDLAREGNQLLTNKEPWKLEKNDPQLSNILWECVQVVANLIGYMQIFLPKTSWKAAEMFSMDLEKQTKNLDKTANKFSIAPETKLSEPELLFGKISDDIIKKQKEKLTKGVQKTQDKTQKPMINFEDFQKLDIRTGEIIKAEPIEQADKLLKLTVNIGEEERTVVAGIAKNYKPGEVEGQQVSILTNLEPKKIFGVESQGMLLMAEDDNGQLAFLRPGQKLKPGSKVR